MATKIYIFTNDEAKKIFLSKIGRKVRLFANNLQVFCMGYFFTIMAKQ